LVPHQSSVLARATATVLGMPGVVAVPARSDHVAPAIGAPILLSLEMLGGARSEPMKEVDWVEACAGRCRQLHCAAAVVAATLLNFKSGTTPLGKN